MRHYAGGGRGRGGVMEGGEGVHNFSVGCQRLSEREASPDGYEREKEGKQTGGMMNRRKKKERGEEKERNR